MERPQAATPPKRTRVWPFAVVALVAVVGAVGWYVSRQPRGSPEAPPNVDAGSPVVEADAGPTLSVDEGDALLRKWAASWSGDGLVAQWLSGASLRHLVSAAQLVAEGSSPRPALPFLSLSGSFVVREEQWPGAKPVKKGKKGPPAPRDERLFISPESYARYDAITKSFASIDAAAAGEAWSKIEPYAEAAFSEISRPGARLHDTLAAALKRVSSVPVPPGEIEVVGKGAVYLFKDPALESLSPAEKQLLRMGPDNLKVIQVQLRTFASHAGFD